MIAAARRSAPANRRESPYGRAWFAHAAGRTTTYLGAQFHRLAARRRSKRAAVAVGHTILVVVYRLLSDNAVYRDLGLNYFDQRDRHHVTRRHVRRIQALGYEVSLSPANA
jgi:hypothetical protein